MSEVNVPDIDEVWPNDPKASKLKLEGATFSRDFARKLEEEPDIVYHRSLSDEELRSRFDSVEIPAGKIHQTVRVREHFKELAWFIDTYLPNGRAKSIALTELESAAHWAIKAVTHHKEDDDAGPE